MECKHCKSKWNSTLQTKQCPFCGKPLVQDEEAITTLSEGLIYIVNEYGVEILSDSKNLMSLVMDYVPGCDRDKKLFFSESYATWK